MSENDFQDDTQKALFISLISMLQGSAMQALGKIINPLTQKAERNLPQAQLFIDMLGMIKEKTTGNLSKEEDQLLNHMLFELRMNYVDEKKMEETETVKASETPEETPQESDGKEASAKETAETSSVTGPPYEKPQEERETKTRAEVKGVSKSKSPGKGTRKKASTRKKSSSSKK